jgi:LTXXQ motif family protein
MISLHKKAMIALAMLAVIAGPTFAQDQTTQQSPPPSTWGPHGMMGTMMGGNGSAEAMCGAMSRHIEGRLAYIKAELQVTDAQEPLWNAYAAAARDNAKTMIARCATMMGPRDTKTSLPDRLDQNEQLMAAHLEAVRAMDNALKPLYAALNETQKKTADQLFWGPRGMM